MNNTPSIGSIGLTVDEINKRVKVLCTEVFCSDEQAKSCLTKIVAKNCDAKKLLSHSSARFTARVIGQNLGPIEQFSLGGIFAREEGRIRTSVGLDVVYVGGNGFDRLDLTSFAAEKKLSAAAAFPATPPPEPGEVVFERLRHPVSAEDVAQLIEMYKLCFTSYLVQLDETLVQTAAASSIFFVARNQNGKIIASAIGECLRVGPLTLLEVSEEAAHPVLRVRGAASGCARRVIAEGKRTLTPPIVAFWEARMWRNILGMGPRVGLTEYAGVLHQHCRIASPEELTTLPNKGEFGSLAVFYSP
ncbi:MAG: hypothetical protein Q7S34_03175 [bacterium]|nr:hypothetical protein [bacterium]